MELYAKPIETKAKDGSIRIEMPRITLDYIDARLAELSIPKDFNYDYREYESVVQNASSHQDAISRLRWRFDIYPQEAEFLLGLTTEEKRTYFIRENCEAEIARWEALRKVLAVQ